MIKDMDSYYVDMLKEVGNICTGNATIALSQMLDRKINLEIPSYKLISLETLTKQLDMPNQVIVGVHMQVLGQIKGDVLLIFPEKSAFSLVDLLSGKGGTEQKMGGLAELGVSALKEIGNIVISAYLGALGTMTKMVILHSTPNLACGTAETIFALAFSKLAKEEGKIVLIDTYFAEESQKVSGNFFLTFDSDSITTILDAARKSTE